MFKSGTLLASYQGVSATWQGITIEYPPSGPQPEGRYVLLQQNKNQILEVRNIGASFEGKAQNFIRSIEKYDECPTLSYYRVAGARVAPVEKFGLGRKFYVRTNIRYFVAN